MNRGSQHRTGSAGISTEVVAQPAVDGLTLNRATLMNNVVYALSTNKRPLSFIGFDLATEKLVTDIDVPGESSGAWQVGSVDGSVYFITNISEMFRFDTSTGDLTKIDGTPSDAYSSDMAIADDGAIYVGSGTTGLVYQYLPEGGTFSSITWTDAEPNYPNAVSVTSKTLFVGTSGLYRPQPGHPADLFAIDRQSGTAQSILPDELSAPNVYGIASSEDVLAASTGLTAPAELLVMNVNDYSSFKLLELDDEPFFDRIAIHDDTVYATGTRSGDLYQVVENRLNRLATPVAGAPTRNLFAQEGRLIGVSAAGVIWTYDLTTGSVKLFDLVAAGAREAAQPVQSFTARADGAFAGGSNVIAVHEFQSSDSERRLVAGGEAKAMTTVGSVLYVATYPYGALLKHSFTSAGLVAIGYFGEGFNRPTDIYYDEHQELLFTTIRRDIEQDGALSIFNPATGELKLHVAQLNGASPLSVTASEGAAFVGSGDGSLVAIDSATGGVRWSTVPVPGQSGISGLAAEGPHVYGATQGGTIFILNARDHSLVAQVPNAIGGFVGRVVLHGGDVYAVSTEQLVRMDPGSGEVEVLLDGLDANIIWPSLSVDDQGSIYVVDGYDLLRVRLTGQGA